MDISNRIKQLRNCLGLTQSEFASRLKSVQNTITGYETGRRTPSKQVIELICREFDVSYEWLLNGVGEMFVSYPLEDEYVRAAAEIAKDDGEEIIRQVIIEYWKLNPEGKKYFKDYLKNVAKGILKEE
jgi:transcriptional regulator with XRE-family HTH domain